MLIYIIHANNINTFRLPKNIVGSYMLNDIDLDGKVRSLINISSEENKWFFNSNSDVSIMYNGSNVEKIEIIPYNFYTLNYFNKEYIMLYIFPGYESGATIKSVSDGAQILLGMDPSCDIAYTTKNISAKQLQLNYNHGKWKIKNLDPKIPAYINKVRKNTDLLSSFDVIFIMGIKIVFFGNKFLISYPPNSVIFMSNKFVTNDFQYAVKDNPSHENVKELYSFYDYFFKSPIFKKKYDDYSITITPPEEKVKDSGANIISEVVPSALMSVTSLVSFYFSFVTFKNGQNNPGVNTMDNKEAFVTSAIMCVVMLITGIVWPIIEHFASKIKCFILGRVRVSNYKKYLKRKDKEMNDVIGVEKGVLYFNNISLEECQDAIRTKNANLFSRNIGTDSFLQFKCGVGKVKSSIKIDYHKPDFIVQTDKLYNNIDKLISKYEFIDDATFVTTLYNTSLAVINSEEQYSNFLKAIILQLVTLHDYENLKLVILTKEGSELSLIKNLNHCWDNEHAFRYFATNLHEAENISSSLMKMANKINNQGNNHINTYYVIISDCIEKYKSIKIIDYILKNAHDDDVKKCMSLLMFSNKVTNIPIGCQNFINYDDKESSFFSSEMSEKDISKFKPSYIDNSIDFYDCIERLSNIPIKLSVSENTNSGSLPNKLGFLEMYGVGNINQLNIIERWKNASISSTLAAPIGVDPNGNLLLLDLHEKKHGPHGLVAGMTGSGKSEFIVTYILSLAINYSPDEVQFVLIDYKGGGLAGAFENRKTGVKLPHLVGTITNLDKAEMNRTLVSIKSELQRRQKVFNAAKEKLNTGSIDIYKYQMLVRDGSLDEPMSHLFIFCDEFAELKSQQPEFMDELVSAARIGRSLGIHLILATQKPSGVVDDQIWANSKFKVCCKVQTADDSNEMLRKPDAAYIKESGRFYLQVGYDEYYIMGQSAYSGVQYVPSEIVVTNMDNSISFIDNNGEVYRNVNMKVESSKEEEPKENLGEELNNILRYIVDVAKENNYQNHQLWLDNVPKRLFYGDVVKKYGEVKANVCDICPIIGEYDNPEAQSQGCVSLPITGTGNTILLGVSGSGKYTLLSTLVFSTIINHTCKEVNFYILDFGAEKFNSFKAAPHVGDVLTINDKNKIRYFFYMLQSEMDRRQKYYSENGGDYVIDAKNGKAAFPNIVCIIYGLEVFKENFDELYDGLFSSIIRLSSKVGIDFIVSASSSNSIGLSIENNFKQYVLLKLSDESDYGFILKGGHAPSNNPGRGLIMQDEVAVEFQTALICDEMKQKEYLDSVFVQLNNVMKEPAKGVPEIPKKISFSSILPLIKSIDNVPLGINVLTAQQEYFDFSSKVSVFSATENKNTMKFFSRFTTIISSLPNTNLVVLNSDTEFNIKVDERAKLYSSDFSKIVNVLYSNCEKINSTKSDKKFVILIIGYSGLNKSLKKKKEEDDSIHTLDDLVLLSNNDSFKFLVYDNENKFDSLMNSEISDLFDNSTGIWIGVDYDSQSVFETQEMTDDASSITQSNELILSIKDAEPSIVRFPTVT